MNEVNPKLIIGVIAVVLAVGIISVSDLSYSDSVEPMHGHLYPNGTDNRDHIHGQLDLTNFFIAEFMNLI